MATAYTDVDLMILNRWDEVRALREAYDDLLGHIRDVVEATLYKVCTFAGEKGLSAACDPKRPSIWFWKTDWATRKNDPGIRFEIFDFVPSECGKQIEGCPSIYLWTIDLVKLKLRERSEEFGRALRAEMPPELRSKWSDERSDTTTCPLVLNCGEVTDADRVRLVKDPDALARFMAERIDEFMEVVPHIDATLQKMTRR